MIKELKSLWLGTVLLDLFIVLVKYGKARSQVYIYVIPTFVTFLIQAYELLSLNNVYLDISIFFIGIKLILCSYILSLSTYIYNDLTDVEIDKVNGANMPLVEGKATKSYTLFWFIALNVIGLILSLSVSIASFTFASIYVALSIAYSHPRINLKNKFPWKTIVNALGGSIFSLYGGIIVGNSNDVIQNTFEPTVSVIFAAFSFFLYIFILAPIGDIRDYKGDKLGGKRTIPVVLGIRHTILMMYFVPLIIISIIITLLATDFTYIGTIGFVAVLVTCLVTEIQLYSISKELDNGSFRNIKKTRTKMRMTHIVFQFSLLFAFIRF
jgi:geranylgeranylglycerol-phosphate geranylgeranyltransferase